MSKSMLSQLIDEIDSRLPLEKLEQAKNLLKIPAIPTKDEAKTLATEKLLATLKVVGLATREEVESLERRIAELEEKFASLKETELHEELKATESD